MIPLAFLKYQSNIELDMAVPRFVNNQLLENLNYLYDIEEDSGFETAIFPLVPVGCYRDDGFSYKKKLQEIQSIFADSILRTGNLCITPLNNYVIYKIIKTVIELSVADGKSTYIAIDQQLRERLNSCHDYFTIHDDTGHPYNYVATAISDLHNYLDFLFDDWDFLEPYANQLIAQYLQSGQLTEYDENRLELLLPMVSDDLYERFIEERGAAMNERMRGNTNITITGDGGTVNVGDNGTVSTANSKTTTTHSDTKKKTKIEKYLIPIVVAAITAAGAIIAAIIK